MADLQELLQHLVDVRGSDLHLKAGATPHVRVDGHLEATPYQPMEAPEVEAMAHELMPKPRAEEFAETGEADFAHSVPGVGRFRVNVYRQRGSVGLVIRRVIPGIPTWDQLGLPPMVERLATETRGLVVVTGPTASGKTTTVNAIVDQINQARPVHIVTIEDPIEFLHSDKQAIISQREVGTDTASYAEAMRRVARQGPDVLFVGEMVDVDTLAAALAVAETGHLVLTTMRTTTVAETVARLVDFFPPVYQHQARLSLAACLRAVIAQRLLERADGRGRIAAVEVLVNTPKVFECIADPDRQVALERLIAEGEYHGMQTFDQALLALFKEGLVSFRDALAVATQPEDLRFAMQQA
ncbi:MAG TPA: PilT/PilU family type 4a pilus ATPase, partial [Acidimicrobiales bacterium]